MPESPIEVAEVTAEDHQREVIKRSKMQGEVEKLYIGELHSELSWVRTYSSIIKTKKIEIKKTSFDRRRLKEERCNIKNRRKSQQEHIKTAHRIIDKICEIINKDDYWAYSVTELKGTTDGFLIGGLALLNKGIKHTASKFKAEHFKESGK